MKTIIHANCVVAYGDQILLVREKEGFWNLPGGHLNFGEELIDGVRREVWEETGLIVMPEALIGIYTGLRSGHHLLNFIFLTGSANTEVKPNDTDIIDIRWFSLSEIEAIPDSEILNPAKFRKILNDLGDKQTLPISHIGEWLYVKSPQERNSLR